jgi:uncharacterized protein YjbI with pentapeptide repeats
LYVYKDLTECDFRDIRGERMGFDDSNWSDSLFEGANFRKAFLRGEMVPGVVLTGVDFRDTELIIQLDGVDLSGLDFRGAQFTCDSSAAGACLDGADLRKASVDELDLTGASLKGADVRNVDFCEATVDGMSLAGAKVAGAQFWEDQIAKVDVTGVVGRLVIRPVPPGG